MIKPTVGRVVLYNPTQHDPGGVTGKQHPALVCDVHSDTCVNLVCFSSIGKPYSKLSVRLIQPEDEPQINLGCAQWMEYQLGQAAKTEQMEAALVHSGGPDSIRPSKIWEPLDDVAENPPETEASPEVGAALVGSGEDNQADDSSAQEGGSNQVA